MKLSCLYSGGHIHTFEIERANLLAELTVSMESGESVFAVWDSSGEHQLAIINLNQLQQAWVTLE